MKKFFAIFDFEGTVGPLEYLGIGTLAMALKYFLDGEVAEGLFHLPWTPWQYLDPLGTTASFLTANLNDRKFLLAMSIIALPFGWLGLSLTAKRLRSLKAPLAFVVFFFVPLINLLFFLMLSVIPVASDSKEEVRNERPLLDATLAILLSIAVGVGAVFLAAHSSAYGGGLFAAAPFCLGLSSAIIYSWNRQRSRKECIAIAWCACAAISFALLCFAFEGIICILMAAPFCLPLAALGAVVGHRMQPNFRGPKPSAVALALLAIFPTFMIGSENHLHRPTDQFAVTSAVEINAPREIVWKNVVTFSKLDEPKELMFKSGIAYPMRAEIKGKGVGAIRYCIFSTGPFVEPITVWDQPHVLEFSVSQVPAPMNELSPYPGLHPPHLDGYFISHKGRFVLTELPNGRTRLAGTTWYEHNLWPQAYWAIWSDYIIHNIHLRVLNHVKRLSEKDTARIFAK